MDTSVCTHVCFLPHAHGPRKMDVRLLSRSHVSRSSGPSPMLAVHTQIRILVTSSWCERIIFGHQGRRGRCRAGHARTREVRVLYFVCWDYLTIPWAGSPGHSDGEYPAIGTLTASDRHMGKGIISYTSIETILYWS